MNRPSRVAVVTGASRGIGRATCLALAERGLGLVLVGRASTELELTESLCLSLGAPSVERMPADLADPSAVESTALWLSELSPIPEILIHNAGVIHRDPIERMPIGAFREQLEVNLTAPWILTRALLPRLRSSRRGRILFVASISSVLGTPNQSAYAASKWGLVGFMKSLAEEISDSGLMTAAVLPGSVDTRMLKGSSFTARISPEEVAKTLLFLALDAPLAHNGASVEMFGT